MICTCGNETDHEIARRETADGVTVYLWSDGAVTGRMGFALRGVTLVRPKTAEAIRRERAAGWMLMGDVCLYDLDEVGALYDACRWAARRGLGVAGARERLVNSKGPRVTPHWEVYQTDRDGNPRVRVWRLPRIAWHGLAVWDEVAPGHSRGRYLVCTVDRDGVAESTGMYFSNLRDLAAYLDEVRAS